jgi:protein phosphatase
VGQKRPHNEDAFLIDQSIGLYLVADGVGGNAMGEVASRETVEQIHGFVRMGRGSLERYAQEGDPAGREVVRRLLESAVQNATYMVFGMGQVDPDQRGMSTTLSALLVVGSTGFIAQVGDSRVYRVRSGHSEQLTEDHTLVNYKVKQGLLTPQQALTAKGKNVLVRAVGHRDYVEVDSIVTLVEPGDRYVLCSDGLHGYLNDGELEGFVGGHNLEAAAQQLIALANRRGGKDNITAIVVAIE